MKRGGFLKRRTRLAPVSARRGRAAGRDSLPRAEWRELVLALWRRAGNYCEVRLGHTRCRRYACDPHHVVKRSQGGADELRNLVALCRSHHSAVDRAYKDGRLLIHFTETPGDFTYEVVKKISKWHK